MRRIVGGIVNEKGLTIGVTLTLIFSLLVLNSIAEYSLRQHILYILLGSLLFIIFSAIDFEVLSIFANHFYIGSLFLLILPLIIGQIKRGAVRWIDIMGFTVQPAEIVRPFLLIFFATYLTQKELSFRRILRACFLVLIPVFLVAIQPSLGVAILTFMGFLGTLLASGINKKNFLIMGVLIILFLPLLWFVLAPYQRQRLESFINPHIDPTGAGYNSIQSMISVGSGGLWGRGLGQGAQTQLFFLPERHTDFVFASICEELGFVGAMLVIGIFVFILYRISKILGEARNFASRSFIFGIFLILLSQTTIHIGMNLGLLPITGVPLPLVSLGGSSLVGTMIGLGMVIGAKKKIFS